MTEELKPCPFCLGKNPIVVKDVQYPDTPRARTWYAVECNVCDATGDWDLGESGAIEKWNTRPIEDALQAKINLLTFELAAARGRIDRDKPWLLPHGQTVWYNGSPVDPIAEIMELRAEVERLRAIAATHQLS